MDLATFFIGPASGWVQAIGSIGAILGSYHLGGAAYRRALVQKEIDELNLSKHKQGVLLEIFSFAEAVDSAVLAQCCMPPNFSWKPIKALSDDLLAQCTSLPLFELPEANQIRELQRIRQAALTYIGYSTRVIDLGEQPPDFYKQAGLFAQTSKVDAVAARIQSQSYIEQLEHQINKLNPRRIETKWLRMRKRKA